MIITDAQIHLWERDHPDRPWPAHGRGHEHAPQLLAPAVLAQMDHVGVQRAVLVPPSWVGDDNDLCLQAARDYPQRFAVMGRFSIHNGAQAQALHTLLQQSGLLGIRLTFHRPFMAQWLHDGTADWFWPLAQEHEIAVMVFPPDETQAIADVAKRYPGLRLVIDHLALRQQPLDDDGTARSFAQRIRPVLELARYPNVAVKASCLPNMVTSGYPFTELHKPLEEVIDRFGPERVFWGSDLSRLRGSYEECVDLFREALTFLNDEQCALVMGEAIARWLRWPLPITES